MEDKLIRQESKTKKDLTALVRQQTGLSEILNAASLSQIRRVEGLSYLQDMIIFLIQDLCNFFNLNRSMSDIQIGQTAGLIIELYHHFKAEDIALCFKNIKILKYGKLYEGLDGSKILDFINTYDLERQNEIIKLKMEENKSHTALDFNDYPKAYVEALVKIGAEIKHK